MTIKYQGTLKLLPNQLTLQDENISIDVNKVVTNKIFFIPIHPFNRIIAYSLENVKCIVVLGNLPLTSSKTLLYWYVQIIMSAQIHYISSLPSFLRKKAGK